MAIALMLAVMLAVANVFSMTSLASGRAIGQSETIETATAFEQAVRTQLGRLKSSLTGNDTLLLIESPPPIAAMPETNAGPLALSLRHDRLVFIAQGSSTDTFRSQTDRNVASPTGPGRLLFSSPEALIYFGPGDPDGQGLNNVVARDWILAQRIILLGAPNIAGGAFQSFTGETPILQYPLNTLVTAPPQGLYACGVDAVQETSLQLAMRVRNALAASASIAGLWDLNIAPSEVNTVRPTGPTDNYKYYGRAAFNLAPRISDLRIEWTDGSVVDPTVVTPFPTPAQLPAFGTQWFGQRRDTADIAANMPPPGTLQGWTGPGDVGGVSGDVCEKREWLRVFDPAVTQPESMPAAYGQNPGPGAIEFSTNGFVNGYGAIWTGATWAYRPKALRFTFRVYDSRDRLSSAEAYDTTPWQSPTLWVPGPGANPEPVRRFGLEYSFVVKLP